jgi:pilus assembly protein Flp/PilA
MNGLVENGGPFESTLGHLEGEATGKWCDKLMRFVRAEDGPTAVEYAVMLALIITVCISAVTNLGASTNRTFSTVTTSWRPPAHEGRLSHIAKCRSPRGYVSGGFRVE